jgi:quinol monooxygenase YgiN
MIEVEVYYRLNPGTAKTFLDKLSQIRMRELTRAEPGNLQYDYFYDAQDENTVLLLEKWANQELLTAHEHSDHFYRLPWAKEGCVLSIEKIRHDLPD